MFASSRGGLPGKKYFLLLAASLVLTLYVHRTITGPEHPTLAKSWFANDTRIEEILRENVETNFTYLEIFKPYYIKSPGITTPTTFQAEYDIWFRFFWFYPLDPETILDCENYRLGGVIFIDGRIKIFELVRADVGYI